MNTNKHENLLYKDLSCQIQGIAIEVRKNFGSGLKEIIYQNAFAEELTIKNIKFEKEVPIQIFSPKTGKRLGTYRPDFIIEGKILVELKAAEKIPKMFLDQIYSYLRNSKYELGYFINFASPKLYVKRVIYTNDRKPFLKVFSCFFVFLFVLFSVLTSPQARGTGASLFISPFSGSVTLGGTFDVSVLINTGENSINAVDISLKFPADMLQVVNPSAGRSFISIWIQQPRFSNSQGTLTFQGGVPSPGIKTSSGLVTTITFRAIKTGQARVDFVSAKILKNDGRGTDILTAKSGAVFDVFPPAPAGPIVSSPTHFDSNAWYANASPLFTWQREEGVDAFSWSLDDNSKGVPDDTPDGNQTSISFSNLSDGIYFFHIKARAHNLWGGITTYIVRVDRAAPAQFPLEIIPAKETDDSNPLVIFSTTDNISGIDHYEIKLVDLSLDQESEPLFIEARSPYQFRDLKQGSYRVVVRAADQAGNNVISSETLVILPSRAIFAVRARGLVFLGIIVPWWLLWLMLTALLSLLAVYILWRFERRRHDFHHMREHLEKDLVQLQSHYREFSSQSEEARKAMKMMEDSQNQPKSKF